MNAFKWFCGLPCSYRINSTSVFCAWQAKITIVEKDRKKWKSQWKGLMRFVLWVWALLSWSDSILQWATVQLYCVRLKQSKPSSFPGSDKVCWSQLIAAAAATGRARTEYTKTTLLVSLGPCALWASGTFAALTLGGAIASEPYKTGSC